MFNNHFNLGNSHVKARKLLLVEKLNLGNVMSLTLLNNITLVIHLNSIEDYDSPRVAASAFLLYLSSGQKPYISRFGLFQTFKIKNYDITMRVDLSTKNVNSFLSFFFFTVLTRLSKSGLKRNVLTSPKGIVARFAISDLSFIQLAETHPAFFKWSDILEVNFITSCKSQVYFDTLFSTYKFK